MNLLSHPFQQVNALLLAVTAILLAGCGSPSYQLAKGGGKPAEPMELKAAAAGIELSVVGLIIFDGPGAWKHQAYWDEYVVRVANHRVEPVVIETFALGDVLDRNVAPGTDPWELEKAGHRHERDLQGLRAPADAAGSAHQRQALARGTASAGALAMLYVPGVAPAALGPALIYGAPLVLVAAAPVLFANKFLIDPKNRALVLAEFDRRRLKLPVALEPGATATGSVFFPLTPGPERLSVRGRAGADALAVTVALPGLEGLHFTYVPDKAALLAAKPPRLFEYRRPIPERKALPPPPGQ